ncbi:MAG: hypothetical protein LBL58_18510 [Tannerellaceae bacterium]|jgi:hypothetical protein|nr:hypothetical protein [Tannerellaceae bacterium]
MKILLIVLNFVCISVTAQVPSEIVAISDTVMINDICIEQICFGDSIKKMIKYFGKPDTIIYHPSEEGEFIEPSHTSYWYHNTIFYEIHHPGITDGLFYGCRVNRDSTSIVIRGIKINIGKTRIEEIKNIFPASVMQMKGNHHDKFIHIYIAFPSSLKPIAEGLIFEVSLWFIDEVLKEVETSFYLN